jgi:hypothetical protein
MHHRWESSRQILAAASLRLLLRRVELHRGLLRLIRAELPAHIAERCADCLAHEDGRLILFAEAPSWASQLRFYAPAILARINAEGYRYREIRVRNLPISSPAAAKAQAENLHRPSRAAFDAVRECAASCSSKELANALSRLGATMAQHCETSDERGSPGVFSGKGKPPQA